MIKVQVCDHRGMFTLIKAPITGISYMFRFEIEDNTYFGLWEIIFTNL